MEIINVKNITYRYGKEGNLYENFSCCINQNSACGIIGFNGAGKSTLIKMMLGIIKPKQGTVEIRGKDVYRHRKELMYNIGVIWGQKPTLWWDLPVLDSYKMLKKIYRISDENWKNRVAYLDSKFSVSEYWDQTLRTLSLGQRVKAEIVASLLHRPKILIYDEPFIGLDFLVRRKMIDLLKEYREENECTLLLTSHNMADIKELCDDLLLINKGKILYCGKISQMMEKYHTIQKINVTFQNEKFVLPDDMKNVVTIIDKTDNQKQIIFDTDKVAYHEVIRRILEYNEVQRIEEDDNLLEQIVEKLIMKG